MKFSTKKKILVIAVSVPCIFNMVGCLRNVESSKSNNFSDSSITTSTDYIESTSESMSIDTVETTTEPSSFQDYLGETIPVKKIDQSNFNYEDLTIFIGDIGGYGLGRDNPMLLQKLREYFSDDSLETIDIPYFVDPENSFDSVMDSIDMRLDMDFIRYIFEENGWRLWIDPIPDSYKEEKFPEIVDKFKHNKYLDLNAQYWDGFYYQPDKYGFDGKHITSVDYLNPENEELLQLVCVMQIQNYNELWEELAATMKNDTVDSIEIGLTADGHYMWYPSEQQFNIFSHFFHKIPGCENIDILVPETREDLMASGINVEKYDEMCEKVFGGAKMEKYKSQDHMS